MGEQEKTVTPAGSRTDNGISLKPLRIAGIVVGGIVMAFSSVGWLPYLGASLSGFDPDASGPGAIGQQIVRAFFLLWIVSWSVGLFIVLVATAGWLRSTRWALLGLTGVMLAVSLVTYVIGSAW